MRAPSAAAGDQDNVQLNDDHSAASPSDVDESSNSTPHSASESSTAGSNSTRHKIASPEDIAAASEARTIKYSRLMVLGVLLLSATIAGVMTYIFTKNSEQSNFEVEFSSFALEIGDISSENLMNVYLLLQGLSSTITSYALYSNSTWPYVTVPYMEVQGRSFLDVANAETVVFSPIVRNVSEWNEYAVANQWWLQESYSLESEAAIEAKPIPSEMFYKSRGTILPEPQIPGTLYSPRWQQAHAPPDASVINFNLLSNEIYAKIFHVVEKSRSPGLSEIFDTSFLVDHDHGHEGYLTNNDEHNKHGEHDEHDEHDELEEINAVVEGAHVESLLVQPIYEKYDSNGYPGGDLVGTLAVVIPWDIYFRNLLPDSAETIVCVVRNTCGDVFTHEITGLRSSLLGVGDLHESKYDYLEHVVAYGRPTNVDMNEDIVSHIDGADSSHCQYTMSIYPTVEFEESYQTNNAAIYTTVVVLIFVFTTFVFVVYDFLVQRRQDRVHSGAMKSNAIISSLFPAEVRERLFQNSLETDGAKGNRPFGKYTGKNIEPAARFRLKSYLDNDNADSATKTTHADGTEVKAMPEMYDTKPIADLFPNTTVMFADIAGFTAWSSVREPSQVFTLLETVYRAFDMIAKRRRVFKVETVGDCYVAVTGLPEPRKDHAVMMARFARDCMVRMNEITHQLDTTLGPDTSDLAMRFGLHSGPVTAGVLRGEKSRFQLFGDTVNTAARVESTGMRNRIHLSQDTADLLVEAGKSHWIVAREDVVVAKGKGIMNTYWLLPRDSANPEEFNRDVKEQMIRTLEGDTNHLAAPVPNNEDAVPIQTEFTPKVSRLVDWNVDVLKRLLVLIVAKRAAQQTRNSSSAEGVKKAEIAILSAHDMPLKEVRDIIILPKFDAKTQRNLMNSHDIQLSSEVISQLRTYVHSLAGRYRENPFHNFEHASHVTMSVSKLLSRIVAPDIDVEDGDLASNLHDHTYGITSDPLTQFAVVISALVHDVDHVGIPNFLLAKENPRLASQYENQSVAEQNSVDIAWDTLMEPQYAELRSCIYTDTDELLRFRQLVATTVLATDIFDKNLSDLRKKRWEMAFANAAEAPNTPEDVNRKATIVIEHLIQASDVAHTMQHWHVYQKWNERLYEEMLHAYKTGRWDRNPTPGWYEGELGFFDNYVIPLAKKLKDCGVFGVSSDEYLTYALQNRSEWASKGQDIVMKMAAKYGDDQPASETALPKPE